MVFNLVHSNLCEVANDNSYRGSIVNNLFVFTRIRLLLAYIHPTSYLMALD